jgi:hypothetical protein
MAPASGQYLPPTVLDVAWSPDDVHVAAMENGVIRLRRTSDLAVVAERDDVGNGPLAFCDGGRLLAFGGGDRKLHVCEVPSLIDRGAVPLANPSYQVFDIDGVVGGGLFVAASDNGGYSEDENGSTIAHGSPSVTLVDAGRVAYVGTIESGRPASQLELDRWRARLLVVAYTGIGVWDLAGTQQTLFTPYSDREEKLTHARVAASAIAVCERWLATVPEVSFTTLSLDFWDPTTYARLATSTALAHPPAWIAASPDGARLLASEPDGVRMWAVDVP